MFHIKVALGTEKVAFTEYIKHLSSIFLAKKGWKKILCSFSRVKLSLSEYLNEKVNSQR